MLQYVFGYGSLISREARNQTSESQTVVSARVRGFQRYWSAFPLYGWSPLAVKESAGASCNGVLIALTPQQLEMFDEREGGYARQIVQHSEIELLEDLDLGSSLVWIYTPLHPLLPGEDSPILQSYVDVTLTGCLEYGPAFAREFVKTTEQWDSPWLDDRARPTYSCRHCAQAE